MHVVVTAEGPIPLNMRLDQSTDQMIWWRRLQSRINCAMMVVPCLSLGLGKRTLCVYLQIFDYHQISLDLQNNNGFLVTLISAKVGEALCKRNHLTLSPSRLMAWYANGVLTSLKARHTNLVARSQSKHSFAALWSISSSCPWLIISFVICICS